MSLDSDARSSYKMSVSNSEGIPIESVEFYFYFLSLSVIRLGRHASWSTTRCESVRRKSRHSDFNNCVSFTIQTIVSTTVSDRIVEFKMSVFRCISRSPRQQWDTLVQCKAQIMEFVWSPTTGGGIKLSAVKFMQRMIVLMTRGVSDPRVRAPLLSDLFICLYRRNHSFRTGMIPTFHLSPQTIPLFPRRIWRLRA